MRCPTGSHGNSSDCSAGKKNSLFAQFDLWIRPHSFCNELSVCVRVWDKNKNRQKKRKGKIKRQKPGKLELRTQDEKNECRREMKRDERIEIR